MGKRKTLTENLTLGKSQKIANTLRKDIITGKYQPGQQLPTRVVLERKYKVSPETLQRSFDELKADGFLRAQRRGGTFVVDFPPHRNRYALALGSDMKDPGYPQFFKVLAEQAKRLDGKDHASIPIYYGVAHKAENPDIIRLSEDMERHRLAGVIYCGFVPDRFKLATIPQVLISSTQVDQFEAVSKLAMSTEHYVQKAVSYFASQGCKRLGVLCIVGWERKAHVHLVKACREAGILFEDHWLQAVGLPDPQTARRMTHLLMHADHRRRPDALLIADDNILPHALEGLDDAGVKAMQDVCVVAHANFPTSVESDRNIRRLGYDAREVIRSGIDLINEMHTNDNQSRSCPIEPYFEEELTL